MKKKIFALALSLILALSLMAVPAAAEEEDVDIAFEITSEGSYDAAVTQEGEYLYISFTPSETGYYNIYTTGDLDTVGYLYDSDWVQIAYDDDTGEDYNMSINPGELTAGETYYIAVYLYDSTLTGEFTLIVHKHGELTYVEELEAVQCETDGYEAYWTCETCGKIYSDAEATEELDEPVVILAHTYPEPGEDYSNPTFYISSDEQEGVTAVFTCTECGETVEVEGYFYNEYLGEGNNYIYRFELYCRVDFNGTVYSNSSRKYKTISSFSGVTMGSNNPTDLIFSDYDVEAAIGNSVTITGTLDYGKELSDVHYNVVAWLGDIVAFSNDESVATVEVDDLDVTITAVGEGTTIIYIFGYNHYYYYYSDSDEFDDECMVAITVTVSEAADYSVIASETTASYTLGSGSGAVIAVDADIDNFTGVTVAGAELEQGTDYIVTEGSTIITFTESYLETLEPGTYDVEISFTTGTAEASLTIEAASAEEAEASESGTGSGSSSEDSSETGSASDSAAESTDSDGTNTASDTDSSTDTSDDAAEVGDFSNILLWITIGFIAAAGLTCTGLRRRFSR